MGELTLENDWMSIIRKSNILDTLNKVVGEDRSLMAYIGAILNMLNNKSYVTDCSELLDNLMMYIKPAVLVQFYNDFIVCLLNSESFDTLARFIHILPSHLHSADIVKQSLLEMNEESLVLACLPKPPLLKNSSTDERVMTIKDRKLQLETIVALISRNCITTQLSVGLLLPYVQQLQKKHIYSIYQALRTLKATPKQMNEIIRNLPTKSGQSICLAGLLNNTTSCKHFCLIFCNLIQGLFEQEKEFIVSILSLIIVPISNVDHLDNNIIDLFHFITNCLNDIKFLHCWDVLVMFIEKTVLAWERNYFNDHSQCNCTQCQLKSVLVSTLTLLGSKKSNFPYLKELESCLITFFKIWPIELLSKSFELQSMDWPWHYLSKYPKKSNFLFVIEQLLPCHDLFNNMSLQAANDTDKKQFEVLAQQVHSVVVQSSVEPLSFQEGYSLLGSQFEMLLQAHPKFCCSLFSKLSCVDDSFFIESLSFVMPLLLNRYVRSVDPSLKDHLKSTLNHLCPICPKLVLSQIVEPVLLECQNNIETKSDLLDILVIISKSYSSQQLVQLTLYLLETKLSNLQKRGYKLMINLYNDTLLEAILNINQEDCTARKERSSLLEHIIQQLPSTVYEQAPSNIILQLLSECICSMKENNEKCRQHALNGINFLCVGYANSPQLLINCIASGMVHSDTNFISASIIAISKSIYAAQMTDLAYLVTLYDAFKRYYTLNNKGILKSIMVYIKIIISLLEFDSLFSFLKHVKPDFIHHDRNKMQQLVSKLSKRMSKEELLQVLPEQHHKLMKNVLKEQRKTENKQVDVATVGRFNKAFNDVANSVFTAKTTKTVYDRITMNEEMEITQKSTFNLQDEYDMKDGKLIIEEKNDNKAESPEDLVREMMTSNEMYKRKGLSVRFANTVKKSKEDDLDTEIDSKVKKIKKKSKKGMKSIGNNYKSKRGKGDIKKSGQLDPYAYIPLR